MLASLFSFPRYFLCLALLQVPRDMMGSSSCSSFLPCLSFKTCLSALGQ